LNYLKDFKNYKTLNLKSRWLIQALWQQYCNEFIAATTPELTIEILNSVFYSS